MQIYYDKKDKHWSTYGSQTAAISYAYDLNLISFVNQNTIDFFCYIFSLVIPYETDNFITQQIYKEHTDTYWYITFLDIVILIVLCFVGCFVRLC